MVSKLCTFLTVCLVLCTECVSDNSSNVAFVIDDTASMTPVISQVKGKVQEMFQVIYGSESSLIGDFILITFNDVETFENDIDFNDFNRDAIKLRTRTRESEVFLTALDKIWANGGGFVRQELSLRGIHKAIGECNPNSYIYVFTDESPRDSYLENTIKYSAQQKSIQINFLLTVRKLLDDRVYKNIAKATSGEVFLINEDDVDQILDYIKIRMQNPSTTLLTVKNPPGKSNFSVTADEDMKHLFFMTNTDTGSNVDLKITGPDGNKADTIDLVDTSNTKCVVVENPGNGSYVATINSDGSSETSVNAAVSVDFSVGFSRWNTNSITNTKVKPVRDEESYLLIQLKLTGTTDAIVKNITILNMDGKELTRLSANVINATEKLYITTFKPPNQTFKIGIEATDTETGKPLKRVYRSPIEPQPITTDNSLQNKQPEVTIENGPKIDAKYGDSIKLRCKVNAYPKPVIVWEDEETGLELPSTVSILELPYEYMSDLEINKITKDGSYKCKATSKQKEIISASIKVETFREKYLNVLESPKDTKIDYEKDTKLYCKIDAWPPARIEWYKNDKELTNDGDFEIFDNNATLLVKKMRPELKGLYSCRAINDDTTRTFNFKLSMSDVGMPEIDHSKSTETAIGGTKATISCRITKGAPEPKINWTFKREGSGNFVNMPETGQEIQIDSVNMDNAGIYRCVAKNMIGEDSHETKLMVRYAPVIEKSENAKIVIIGTSAAIVCRILEGFPKPMITWVFKRQGAIQFITLPETEPEINIGRVEEDDSGVYKCYAKNEVAEDSHEIVMSVHRIPTVIVNQLISAKIGDEVTLSCEVSGEPTPDVKWIKDGMTITTDKTYEIFNHHSLRFVTNVFNWGIYTCAAKNYLGEDSKNTSVVIRDPVIIELPANSSRILEVDTTLHLKCNASGFPRPRISWLFIPSDPNLSPQDIGDNKSVIQIPRVKGIHDGKYKCIAENDFDKNEITYEVSVTAPVEIERPLQKEFSVVKNDHTLRIPCKAKGLPKPKIIWMQDFLVVKMGDLYMQDSEGALIINNPDTLFPRDAKFICIADNDIKQDLEMFTLNFILTPKPNEPTETIYLLKDSSTEIDCKLPHKSTDTIRWYTKDLPITTNKFNLRDARISDTGLYICRVSSSQGSQNAYYQIIVGTEPEFENKKNNESVIAFTEGRNTHLDCYVKGTPTPTVTWWQNGRKLDDAPPFYPIPELNESHLGEFRCEATNPFGTITRTYVIKVTGCTIDYAKKEADKFHPILILNTGNAAEFQNEEGKMIISDNEEIQFVCPDNVQKLYCSKNEFIFVDNPSQHVTYDDLKCNKEVIPSIRVLSNADGQCVNVEESKTIQVGYGFRASFLVVYDACINQRAQQLYFTKHEVSQYASDIKIDSHPFISRYIDYNYDEMFDCSKQKDIIKEGCCFLGRQLVSPEDVSPGIQKTTYFNMNVSPQWNFCGHNSNINEIEGRIRALAKSVKPNKLEVFSGEYEDQSRFLLRDRYGQRRLVPKYSWKVVQIRETEQALAIITINVPNITEEEADELMFCDDICDRTKWMANPEWRNVSKGFSFCCDSFDLAEKINPYYKNLFLGDILL